MYVRTAHEVTLPRGLLLALRIIAALVLLVIPIRFTPIIPGAEHADGAELVTTGDPALVLSTFLGGDLGEIAYAITLDSDNNIYVVGQTESRTNFPRLEPRLSFTMPTDLFIAKIRTDGTMVYSTAFGGTDGHDAAHSVAVDAAGNVYVTGYTTAPDFPVTPDAFQDTFGGGAADAFVVQLNPSGQIVYSSFLGGPGDDRAFDLARTRNGDSYIVGATTMGFTGIPGLEQTMTSNGNADAFLVRLDSTEQPTYGYYLGGDGTDIARSIALDDTGLAYLAGSTTSRDFPISATNAPQRQFGRGGRDAFVATLNTHTNELVLSSYLGGGGTESEHVDLAVDAERNIYLIGTTTSPDFPTMNAVQRDLQGAATSDAFISKIQSSSGELLFSTFLGGERADFGAGIAIDSTGDILITGGTYSAYFPSARSFQDRNAGAADAFVARLSNDGAELLASSYLGGRGDPPIDELGEYGVAITVDDTGNAYVAGSASSPDFPLTSPLADGTHVGFTEAFLATVSPQSLPRDRINDWSLICRPEVVDITGVGMYQQDEQQLVVAGTDWVTLQLGGKFDEPEYEVPHSATFTFGDGKVVERERPYYLLAAGYAYEWSGTPGEVRAAVAERPDRTTARALVAYAPIPQEAGLWTSVGRTTLLNVYRDRSAPISLTLPLPDPLERATDITVKVAFFDNNPDERPLIVRAEASGRSDEISQSNPTSGKMLNIEVLNLTNVPAGTEELRVMFASPVRNGDSGVLLGATMSYPCVEPDLPGDGAPTPSPSLSLSPSPSSSPSPSPSPSAEPDLPGDGTSTPSPTLTPSTKPELPDTTTPTSSPSPSPTPTTSAEGSVVNSGSKDFVFLPILRR
jgi:hypothetical protein